MAPDLTPRFKRLNSQTRSFREPVSHVQHGPFGATQLWHNIIHALQTEVEVRRCRRHLRVHADCFTGADAVDAVLSYLMQNVMFCTSEVSRLKAARLCQALMMEAKVFEPVGTKLFRKQNEMSFEDSSCSLYRFLKPGTSMLYTSGDAENVQPKELKTKWNKNSWCSELRTISNPIATGPSERRINKLLKTINLKPVPPSQSKGSTSTPLMSRAVFEGVWGQQTLLQLLQIVEVPVLDCILTSPSRLQPRACLTPLATEDLIISNMYLERELTATLNLPQLDEWLSVAADLLELFPDQLIVVAGEQLSQLCGDVSSEDKKEQLTSQKRLLFDTIAKYYNRQEKSPLIPEHYLDIHIAILQLIDVEKKEGAIKATQLWLQLLDTSVRDELWRLLTFMATATHQDACRLQKQTDNRSLVCRTFQKAIVQSYKLSQSQVETLIFFLMDNHTELFKTPKSLIEAVRVTLRNMQQGRDPDSITTFTFCQQMTAEEYEDQREATTLESLKLLLHDISVNKSMSVKRKKQLLKEFEKHHPVVFLQHFPSIL